MGVPKKGSHSFRATGTKGALLTFRRRRCVVGERKIKEDPLPPGEKNLVSHDPLLEDAGGWAGRGEFCSPFRARRGKVMLSMDKKKSKWSKGKKRGTSTRSADEKKGASRFLVEKKGCQGGGRVAFFEEKGESCFR